MIETGQAFGARKSRSRPWIVLVAVELVLLAGVAALVWFRYPDYVRHLWAILFGAAVAGVLVVDLAQALAARRRARSFARSFDVSDHIKRLSAREPDDVERELTSEEILEDFVANGRQLLRTGNPAEAAEHFRRAIELDPHRSRYYNYLGMALERMGRHDDAIQSYLKAIAIDYDYSVAHYNLALAFEQTRRQAEALEEWHKYVEIGEVVGEREDKLDRARERIRMLKDQLGD